DDLGAETEGRDTANTVKIDDMVRFASHHMTCDVFGAEKGAAEVGLDDAIAEFFVHVLDARPSRNSPREMRNDRSVIDQHIDLAEVLQHLIDHVFDRPLITDIDSNSE